MNKNEEQIIEQQPTKKARKPRTCKYTDEERQIKKKEHNKSYYLKNKERLQKLNIDNYYKKIKIKSENI